MSNLSNSIRTATSVFVLVAITAIGCNSTNSDTPSSPTFNSGTIAPGATFSYNFENEGTIDYYCSIHAPDMQGQVTVSSSASTAAQDTVRMEGNIFQPGNITVAPNTEVIWVNNADHDHTIVSGDPSSSGDGGNGDGY